MTQHTDRGPCSHFLDDPTGCDRAVGIKGGLVQRRDQRSFRCGMLSGVGAGDEDAWAGAGVAVARACAVGAAEGDAAC